MDEEEKKTPNSDALNAIDLGGRPPVFTERQSLIDKAFAYAEMIDKEGTKPTVTGIALYIFGSRSTFYDYGEKDGFSDIIKKLQFWVENEYEKALREKNPAGPIFALKNMGWKDKTEVEQTVKQEKPDLSKYTPEELAELKALKKKQEG